MDAERLKALLKTPSTAYLDAPLTPTVTRTVTRKALPTKRQGRRSSAQGLWLLLLGGAFLLALLGVAVFAWRRGSAQLTPTTPATPATPLTPSETLTPSVPLTPGLCAVRSPRYLATESDALQFSLYCGECSQPFQISCAKSRPLISQWARAGPNLSQRNDALLDEICQATQGTNASPQRGGVSGAQPPPCV